MINVTRQIAFIHHRDHRLPGTPQLVEQLRRHFQMLGALRAGSVAHIENHIGARGLLQCGLKRLYQLVRQPAYQADRINQHNRAPIRQSQGAGAEEIGMGGSGQLKKYVTEAVNSYFEPIRERRHRFENDLDYVKDVLAEGNRRANEIAKATLAEVAEAMGMVY